MGNEVPKMQPEVEKEFDCVKVIPGEVIFKGKSYDLTKINLETARRLHEDGMKYLKKKTAAGAPPKLPGDK